jgi:hypothetical protein
MNILQFDRSNYYRGLLVVAGKDRIIDPRERALMLQFGELIDFDKRFCEAAIDDLLENKYINRDAIIFSNREIAECFLRDALRLAHVDEDIHRLELAWLKAVAYANGLTEEWLNAEAQRFYEEKDSFDLPASPAILPFL